MFGHLFVFVDVPYHTGVQSSFYGSISKGQCQMRRPALARVAQHWFKQPLGPNPQKTGLWNQGAYPHICDTREPPPFYGGLVFGKPLLLHHRSGLHFPHPEASKKNIQHILFGGPPACLGPQESEVAGITEAFAKVGGKDGPKNQLEVFRKVGFLQLFAV